MMFKRKSLVGSTPFFFELDEIEGFAIDTNFQFEEYTQQIVDYLGLIEYEDLTSVYGTSQEKAMMFHRQNQDVLNS